MARRVNVCRLLKGQLESDIKYAMALTRRTGREYGWEICEDPETKQWFAGKRHAGAKEHGEVTPYVTPIKCKSLGFKMVGSFHTHPKDYEYSIEDALTAAEDREQISCEARSGTGKMNCYRHTPKMGRKIVRAIEKSGVETAHRQLFPEIMKERVCSIQFEKVGRLKRLKERIRPPKLPPARF